MLHQIGTGSQGPVFRGEDPDTGERVAITHLQLKIGPERSRFIAEDLRALMGQLPDHVALTRLIDAGLEGGHPFVVSSLAAGEPLDVALREYGPAVLDDALPRLERIAEALDLAAAKDVCHGALHPGDVMVSARETKVTGLGVAMVLERAGVQLDGRPPYSPPESKVDPAGDRFAFAAIALEWLYGRAIDGPAEAPLALSELPGADTAKLSDAFTTALAPNPSDRFPTCMALVKAIRDAARASPKRKAAAVLPFDADEPAGSAVLSPDPLGDRAVTGATTEFPLEGSPPQPSASRPETTLSETAAPSSSGDSVFWQGSLSASSDSHGSGEGFSLRTLAAVLLAGIAIGVVGGYLIGNARRSSGPAVSEAIESATPPAAAPATTEVSEAPIRAAAPPPQPAETAPARAAQPAEAEPAPAARAVRGDRGPAPPKAAARLLVRTTPAGASVSLDGTIRGQSPLALRDLELGTRTIVVTRPGYVTAERRIALTADRPSRSVDVTLTPVAAARATPRPAPATTSSGLIVESRPPGAVVTINGVRAGTTPLTIETLLPGSHTVLLERPGYRPWSTTVDVKPGERPRVAASLVGGNERE